MPRKQLRLNTGRNARQSLAAVLRDFHREPAADIKRFRAIVHAFSVLLQAHRDEQADHLEERTHVRGR